MADDMRRPDEQVAHMARRQYGLVTREQVLAAGLSAGSLERRLKAGRLQKIGRLVYVVAGAPPTWEQSALGACLDHGPAAVLSHVSAARAWGCEIPGRAELHVTVPYGASGRRHMYGVAVHRSRSIAAADGTMIRRLPVTNVARTLIDLAGTVRPGELAEAVDAALAGRLVAPERLLGALDRSAPQARSGTRALRELVAPWLERAGGLPDSVAECRLRRLIEEAGLPVPVAQYAISDGQGLTIHLDFAWPAQKVALELDGFRWHANPAAHARDSWRTTWLAARGWVVLRITPTEVRARAGEVVAALRQHLARSA